MDFLVRLALFALLEREPCTPSELEAALLDLGLTVSGADLVPYLQKQHLEEGTLGLVIGNRGRAYQLSPKGEERFLELKAQWRRVQPQLEALLDPDA